MDPDSDTKMADEILAEPSYSWKFSLFIILCHGLYMEHACGVSGGWKMLSFGHRYIKTG